MSEWPKEHDWKSCMFRKRHRGFESLSLHQSFVTRMPGGPVFLTALAFLLDTTLFAKSESCPPKPWRRRTTLISKNARISKIMREFVRNGYLICQVRKEAARVI